MVALLDATVGGPTANSYTTVALASGFLAGRLSTEPWYALAADAMMTMTAIREAALIWATRLLDEQVEWVGVPATATQALWWPQHGQVDPQGRAIASTVVPDVVQRATALYALALLRETNEMEMHAPTIGIKSRTLGTTTIVYQDQLPGPTPVAWRIPPEIQQMLQWYGTIRGGVLIPLLRS